MGVRSARFHKVFGPSCLQKAPPGGGATLGPVRVVTIACYQPIIRIGLIAMPASLSSIAWFTSSNR